MIGATAITARIRSRGAGQAMVEFALIVPIFLALLLGLLDLGRVVYAQNAITQDVHAATRFGSVDAPWDAAEIISKAKEVSPAVAFPDSAISGEDADPPLTGTSGDYYPDGVTAGGRVVVQISLPVPLLTPIISNIFGGSITVSARSEELVRSLKSEP